MCVCLYVQTEYVIIYSNNCSAVSILSFLPVKDNVKEFRPCGIINPNRFWYMILIKKIMNKLYREREREGVGREGGRDKKKRERECKVRYIKYTY